MTAIPNIWLSSGPSFTTFTPSGTFVWGLVYAATEKTLTLTADAGTLPAACKLVFTGDATAFEITEIEGEALVTPVLCSAVGDDLRFLAWEQGIVATIKIQPVFTDGTAKSMTMDVQTPAGVSVQSYAVTATFSSALIGACLALGNCNAVWSAGWLTPGVVNNGDSIMEDRSGVGEDDIEAILAAPGNAEISNANPIGSDIALANWVRFTVENNANYGVVKSATAAPAVAGLIVFRGNAGVAGGNKADIWGEGGIKGTPAPAQSFWIDWDNGRTRTQLLWPDINIVLQPLNVPIVFAWRKTGGNTFVYMCQAGAAWKAMWAANTAMASTLYGGCRFGYATQAGEAGKIMRYMSATWSVDPGEAGLQSVFNAIVP